jgi:hypothetical protein
MEWWLKSLLMRWGFVLKRRRQVMVRQPAGDRTLAPEALMQALHGTDVYEGFDFTRFPCDLQGWGGDSPAFAQLIKEVRPSLVIEVGTWKGASAVSMADAAAREGLSTKIVCVDTWLGALEFRMDLADAERFGALECLHGYPRVYDRFLANICHRGHQHRIVPFPMDSASAALWFMSHGVKAGLIYLDASHEEEAVYQDLVDYRQLLAPGGKMFGDDWDWAGVRAAVSIFARDHGLTITHCHDKWVLDAAA